MNKKLGIILLIVALGAVGFALWKNNSKDRGPVACTLEAKLCPDGTAVGRTGPNCEFAPCPTTVPQKNDEPVACTADAKLCPDGSYVGRRAPDCSFAPCPGEETGPVIVP